MAFPNPLRIRYVVLHNDDTLVEASPFQGFGPSWSALTWALALLTSLPSDVLEPIHPLEDLIAQRMGGMRQLLWLPLNISALESLESQELGLFLVLLSGQSAVAQRAAAWIAKQERPILHISTKVADQAVEASQFGFERLTAYCRLVFDKHGQDLSRARRDIVGEALGRWQPPARMPLALSNWSHNITIPNHLALARNGYTLADAAPFVGKTEAEYRRVIIESVRAVDTLRRDVGLKDYHRMSLTRPGLYLVEPAFFRFAYRRFPAEGPLEDAFVAQVLRMLQSQKGLCTQVKYEFFEQMQRSKAAQQIVALRQDDLETFTYAIGLKAAQTCSAVMRLSPAVNHVFPTLSNYARNIRTDNAAARLKTPRLFKNIQKQLLEALGPERIEIIDNNQEPIKIVSDAPIEWLPLRGLPLMLRHDCSRINATPGNLLMAQLAQSEAVTVSPEAIQKVLVLSSFDEDDRLRNMVTSSLMAIADGWHGKVDVQLVRVGSRKAFIDAVNATESLIIVFDGHGSGNAETGVATLRIGKEDVDVWSMRGEIRMPPIVILSACDTQSVDATSHATVGNGFLAIGAQTVLATLLPVDGRESAGFIARLIYRLADFIPAALKVRRRVLNWTEVVAGMQRMLLASEILNRLVGLPTDLDTPRSKLQMDLNIKINGGHDDWFEYLIIKIAEHRGENEEVTRDLVQSTIARAEAIRYVQLGYPENILIDDGSIRALFVPEELDVVTS